MSEFPLTTTPIKSALESMLFVADQPLTAARLAKALEVEESEVRQALQELSDEYYAADRGIQLREVAGGYRFFTHPANSPYVERLFKLSETRRLSPAALETLSIIAYKQPVTRLDISAIRGVNSDGALSTLIARDLVKEVGRQNTPGNPILYGTTKRFLEVFGLRSLSDLSPIKDFEPDAKEKEQIERNLRTEAESAVGEAGIAGAAVGAGAVATISSKTPPTDNPDAHAPAEALEELLEEGWLDN